MPFIGSKLRCDQSSWFAIDLLYIRHNINIRKKLIMSLSKPLSKPLSTLNAFYHYWLLMISTSNGINKGDHLTYAFRMWYNGAVTLNSHYLLPGFVSFAVLNLLLVSEKENANSSDRDCVHLVCITVSPCINWFPNGWPCIWVMITDSIPMTNTIM